MDVTKGEGLGILNDSLRLAEITRQRGLPCVIHYHLCLISVIYVTVGLVDYIFLWVHLES